LKNNDNSDKFTLCPRCGSKYYLENYPIQNTQTCTQCQHEVTTISLIEIKETPEGLPSICTHCGKDGAQDRPFLEEDNTTIYKCKACGKLDGYLLQPFPYFREEEIDDNAYDGKTVQNAKAEENYTQKNQKRKNHPPLNTSTN
jgi:DNA-directed RNA polymerase subunit RPC12/RpoP